MNRQRSVATRIHVLARIAWTVVLVLFAARAIACTSLCNLSGEPAGSSSASPATASLAFARHEGHDSLEERQALPAEQPSHHGDDRVCDEPANPSAQAVSVSAGKGSPAIDALPAPRAPARDWRPSLVAMNAFLPQWVHPPPLRSLLDISPRLRIWHAPACRERVR